MNTIVQGKSMMSKVYIHKPVDWLGEALPDEERVIFSRIKLQIFEFLSTDSLNTELMLKIIDEMNQSGISLYILKEVVELIRIKLLSNNSKKVYLTITLVDALVKNCGPKIHVVVGDEMFMTTFSKITRVWLRGFGSKSKMVANYGLDTIQAWGEGFESRRYLYPHIYGTYTKLRAKSYIKFPGIQYDQRRVPIFLGPITPHEKQIVADYLLENQQMEDIDLLYFSDSDDESDGDHHPNNHQLQLQQQQAQHEQQHQDPFFGQMMETDNIPATNSFSGNMWSNQQSTTNTQSWSKNEDVFWNSLETKQTDDVFSRPPLSPPPSFATEERNPTFVFDWSQFESPPQTNLPNVGAQNDNKTIKEEVDPFHFFDEVSTGVQSHDFSQSMNEQNDKEKVTEETLSKSSLNDQFMTLDPLKDNDFMVKHHQFSQARNQLIHELAKQIESRPALVGNHGNHGDGDCDSGKMKKMMKNSFEGLRDENNTHNSPNTINDWTDSHDIHHHSENRSAVKKSSAYYDPSSDSKNRVCYYGTQRVIRREG